MIQGRGPNAYFRSLWCPAVPAHLLESLLFYPGPGPAGRDELTMNVKVRLWAVISGLSVCVFILWQDCDHCSSLPSWEVLSPPRLLYPVPLHFFMQGHLLSLPPQKSQLGVCEDPVLSLWISLGSVTIRTKYVFRLERERSHLFRPSLSFSDVHSFQCTSLTPLSLSVFPSAYLFFTFLIEV